MRRCPFYKAFLVIADVPEIYMQEFWTTANVHHHSIRFKMDNKKHIVSLESFKEMLHICPRISGQAFNELPFEEENLDFIRFLGHSATIKTLTDVNINKLYQPWRSFAAIINKCLSRKTSGYDSLRLSQAQILWGLYHKRNVNYAFLIWEDFVFQVKHKKQKKSNEMYYPKFTKVIIHHFMSKDPFIPQRNKNTQQFGALLPIELTNEEIRNSKAYKEYHAIAIGEAAPKPKASARRTRSSSDTSITPPTTVATTRPTVAATPRLTAAGKGKQTAKASKDKSLSALSEVARIEAQQLKIVIKRSRQQTHISQPGGSGTDKGTGSKLEVPDVSTNESEEELSLNSFDDEGADDKGKDGNGDEDDKGDDGKEGEEDDDDDDEREVAKNDDKDDTEESGDDDEEEDQGLNIGEEERLNEEEEADELYRDVDINQRRGLQVNQEVEDSHVILTQVHPDGQQESSSVSSQFVTNMLNPTSDAGMESILATASTSVAPLPITAPIMTPFTVTTITTTSQAPILPTPIPSEVKEQVKAQVSKILPRIEQAVNEQLETEVLTRSSHSSRTSYAVAADLSEMELKKILIEKIKGNKSIQRSDAQRNLYKSLVDAYESDKIILDTYGETATLKRRRDDDEDKDKEPSVGLDRGSKRRKEEEPVQTTSQMEEPSHPEFETGVNDQPIIQSSQHPEWFSQPKKPPSPDRDWNKTLPAVHRSIQPRISELAKQADTRSSFNELMDTPLDFSNFIMNRLIVDTLTSELLVGRTYDLEPIDYDKYALWGVSHWGRKRQQFYGFAVNRESTRDVYSKRRIIAVTELKIVEWHSYKHLDWITVQRDDDKLYKFKEGDFKRLRIQDIEDMLLLIVQGKLANLTVEERFAFNFSLRMFTRSIVIQRCVEDLQLGNKDKQNRLMQIDELHKFSDGMLTDVRTTLDDHLKGIQIPYLPQTIWRRSDKDRAATMI
nr:hypothetical protein [Tanacetum cinerariifolium]